MNVNLCVFAGRLTRDPESTTTSSNLKITKFGLAVNGRKEGEVAFVDCVAFGKQAELIEEHVKKGQRLHVTSRFVLESWNDAEGNKRTAPRFYIETFQFVDSKNSDDAPVKASKPKKSEKVAVTKEESSDGDEVPF